MAEDSKTVFSRVCERVKSRLFRGGVSKPNVSSADFDQLIDDIAIAAHQSYKLADGDKESLLKHVRSSVLNSNGNSTYYQLKNAMSVYEARNKIYLDEHEQLKKIENAQARRALFWRATTTFTVALIIFLFYCLADYLGIAMPLSRVAI